MKNTFYVLVFMLAVATAMALAQTSPSGTSSQTTASPSSPSSQTAAPASQDMDRDKDRGKDKKHAKNTSAVDDTTLTQQIQQQLSSDVALKNVQVSVNNGVVNLGGTVASKEEKRRAKQMVAGIAGVRKVHEHLKINASATAAPGSNEPTSASAGATGASSASTTSNTAGSIAGNTTASSTTPQTPTTSASIGSTSSASGMPQSEGANCPCPSGVGTTSGVATQSGTAGMTSAGAQNTQIQNVIQQQIVNSNVQVNQTTNNIVLTGTVPTETDKQKAEEIARKQAGGLTVVNNIQVASSASAAMSNAPSSTLPQAETAPAGTSGATAAGAAGTSATSSGTTAGTAGAQTGATGGAMSSASDLQTQCDTALKREPTLASDQINCVVSGDTIELSGSVMTGKERQTALRIAQSFAGNRRVVDRLTVRGRGQGANTGAPNPNQPGMSPNGGSNPTGVNPSSTPSNPTSSPESNTTPR